MAYDLAKIKSIDKDTVTKFVVGILANFTDTGDPAKKHDSLFTPPVAPVPDVYQALRVWRDNVENGLNYKIDLANEQNLQVGATIPHAPIPPPPTAEKTWQTKASTLRMMQETKQAVTANGGAVNAAFTATITQLATEVGSLFQAGFES